MRSATTLPAWAAISIVPHRLGAILGDARRADPVNAADVRLGRRAALRRRAPVQRERRPPRPPARRGPSSTWRRGSVRRPRRPDPRRVWNHFRASASSAVRPSSPSRYARPSRSNAWVAPRSAASRHAWSAASLGPPVSRASGETDQRVRLAMIRRELATGDPPRPGRAAGQACRPAPPGTGEAKHPACPGPPPRGTISAPWACLAASPRPPRPSCPDGKRLRDPDRRPRRYQRTRRLSRRASVRAGPDAPRRPCAAAPPAGRHWRRARTRPRPPAHRTERRALAHTSVPGRAIRPDRSKRRATRNQRTASWSSLLPAQPSA